MTRRESPLPLNHVVSSRYFQALLSRRVCANMDYVHDPIPSSRDAFARDLASRSCFKLWRSIAGCQFYVESQEPEEG